MSKKLEAFNKENYAIVCREYSKISPEVSAYEIPVEEFDGSIFRILNLRSRFNPELSYFVTKRENLDLALELLSTKMKSEIEIKDGIMVQI